jgi:hypothetical protein
VVEEATLRDASLADDFLDRGTRYCTYRLVFKCRAANFALKRPALLFKRLFYIFLLRKIEKSTARPLDHCRGQA